MLSFPLARLVAASLVTLCLGLTGFAGEAEAQARVTRQGEIKISKMRFSVLKAPDGVRWIVADGDITPGVEDQFRAMAGRAGLADAPVLLNSRGGSLLAGLQLGLEFRRLGTRIAVARIDRKSGKLGSGICASACVYALAGAPTRVVPSGSLIGLHESFQAERRGGRLYMPSDRQGSDETANLTAIKTRYFAAMGVDPSIVELERGVSPTDVRVLSSSEATRYGLNTSRGASTGGSGVPASGTGGFILR